MGQAVTKSQAGGAATICCHAETAVITQLSTLYADTPPEVPVYHRSEIQPDGGSIRILYARNRHQNAVNVPAIVRVRDCCRSLRDNFTPKETFEIREP
ncbi:hypothetical protein GGER_16210 [Serratia rubidaea]